VKTVQATTDLTAKQKIGLLAAQHGITYHQTEFDELADTYSRLSDNEVELDGSGILTGKDNGFLHLEYLRERKQ
jgi:hypothetical protein